MVYKIETSNKRREVNILKKLRVARNGYILISFVFYISGVIYMILPAVSPMAVCICSGVILVAYGIVKIVGYCSEDLYNLAFQHDLACGVFLIVVGVITLGCNLRIRSYLTPALGLLILLDAVLKIQTAKDAKVFGLKTWNEILTFSIIAGIFGVLIIIRPFQGIRVTHIINGCGLLAEGIMNHLTVKETVKITKNSV
ncbi:MAG: DUF308 domain-containing protein [Lachnospiraceae bacterium]